MPKLPDPTPEIRLRSDLLRVEQEHPKRLPHAWLLVGINILVVGFLFMGLSRNGDWTRHLVRAQAIATATGTPQPAAALSSPTVALPSATRPPDTPTSTVTPPPPVGSSLNPPDAYPLTTSSAQTNILFLSIGEGGYQHLFAYQPLSLPLTRLTGGPWQDTSPALSPDGTRLAFASNRAGHWDLYLLELNSGEIKQLTNDLDYESAPSWSPDGAMLVYESYSGDNLELYIRSLDNDQPPINLTGDPAADFSPAWSPQGRQIAFISLRSGEREVWLADLDQSGDKRFTNLSQSSHSSQSHPVWSPDGSSLAWSGVENGLHNIYVWESESGVRLLGGGDWAAWSPDGQTILTALSEPNQSLLTAYRLEDGSLALPPMELSGPVYGLVWTGIALPSPLPQPLAEAAAVTPEPLWVLQISPVTGIPGGRQQLVPLDDVQAPNPLLHDRVDEAFQALRARVAVEAGWDLLGSLESAYLPLAEPYAPGLGEDWLYTGRAFAFNTLPSGAGWLVVVPEPFGSQTYWRVYLRARFQNGNQGEPLHDLTWDFSARHSGEPLAYEQGGAGAQAAPPGYWIDLTALAAAYGWERLPALPTWQSYFPAARYNEFALTGGLDWRSAMLELYPLEALLTPTVVLPPTPTASATPRWQRTATPTITPSPVPTLTPLWTAHP